jgi:hypothetical protein
VSNDFSLPALPDGLPLNPFLKAKMNRANSMGTQQVELPISPELVVTQNLQNPQNLPKGSVRDVRQVLAVPTPRTLPQLPPSLALPATISFSDFVYVYNKILPPDGSVITYRDLANMNLTKYQLSTKEAVMLGAMMGNEQLFKQVDRYAPAKLSVITEGSSGVFRGNPSIQLKTGEIVAGQSVFTGAGTLGSVAQSRTPATPNPQQQPLIAPPNTQQPLVAQVQNRTISSFVPAVGFQNQPVANRTIDNASLFVAGVNPPPAGNFTTPTIALTGTAVPLNLQRWLPYLATLPRANTAMQEAFRLLLVAQLYGHLPLETPEMRGETRDEALQRLAKVKDEQEMVAEAQAKRNPMESKINPLEALLPAWLLNAVNNVGMVDKKGAIHLKSGVLKNLYVRARNQYEHEDIKFEELLSLKPANREEERHLKFLKEAEVFHLLAHMERGGDNETMNLHDLEVAFNRQVLHTHFGFDDDETIIIDKEE